MCPGDDDDDDYDDDDDDDDAFGFFFAKWPSALVRNIAAVTFPSKPI